MNVEGAERVASKRFADGATGARQGYGPPPGQQGDQAQQQQHHQQQWAQATPGARPGAASCACPGGRGKGESGATVERCVLHPHRAEDRCGAAIMWLWRRHHSDHGGACGIYMLFLGNDLWALTPPVPCLAPAFALPCSPLISLAPSGPWDPLQTMTQRSPPSTPRRSTSSSTSSSRDISTTRRRKPRGY